MLSVVICLLGLALLAPAGTVSAQTSSTLPYTGLELIGYESMTPQQQATYNSIQAYVNLSTQIEVAAIYSQAEKALQEGDVLTAYQQTVLARGPLAVTTGNVNSVVIGSTSSSTSSGSTSSTTSSTTGSTTGQ
jgi:Flp pilus assembly protein TadG